jgi:hypothetical protein
MCSAWLASTADKSSGGAAAELGVCLAVHMSWPRIQKNTGCAIIKRNPGIPGMICIGRDIMNAVNEDVGNAPGLAGLLG